MAAPWEKYAGAQAGGSGAAEAKPWENYAAPTETRMETEDEVNARVKAKYSNMSIWDRVSADLGFAGKEVSAIPRGLVKGVASIPTMAADVGVASRNVLTGSNYELPSQMFERDVYDKLLPMNNTPSAKALEFGASLVSGMKLPAPQVKNAAPAGFTRPGVDAIRQQTLANSREAGYVVPPSTTNPSVPNTFIESFGGKIATAQDAALKNQGVTNELAKKSLGLTGEAPLAQETFGAVRKEAGKAYEALRQVGAVSMDDATAQSLDSVSAKFTGSKLKEALGGGNDIPKIIQAIKAEPLTGDTAVDAIALLRNKADEAYRAGSKEIGKGYKSIANTIEGLMEKNLSGEALTAFRDARQLIAKTHSVEGAFNASSGNVVATKLAAQLAKGKPLSGDLRTAAQFGQAFPKAAKEMVDSGAVRNTDAILGSGAAVFTGHPWYLGWPFLRQSARSFLLSDPGQRLATQRPPGISPEAAMALITASERSRQSLLK